MVAPCVGPFYDSIDRSAIRCMRVGNHHQSGRNSGNSERSPSGGCTMEERIAMLKRQETKLWKRSNRCLSIAALMVLACGVVALAQAPAAAPPAQTTPAAAPT